MQYKHEDKVDYINNKFLQNVNCHQQMILNFINRLFKILIEIRREILMNSANLELR
jgi:hypothetical protein